MDISLKHALEQSALANPGRVALRGEGFELTYAQWLERSQALADRLRQQGLASDETVMIKSSNHPLDFVALLATWIASGVAVPVHRTAPAAVLEAVQAKAQCRVCVDLLSSDADIVALPTGEERKAEQARASILNGAALVIFTSGSTGLPKGVVLSHAAFAGKLVQNQRLLNLTAQDVTLLVLNNTFSFGIWMALLTLNHGGTVVTRARFDARQFLETLAHEKITRAGVVPTMIRATFGSLSSGELAEAQARLRAAACLRDVVIGGEPLGIELSIKLRSFIAPAALYDVYGLTETSTSDFVLTPPAYAGHPDTIGTPAAGVRCRITNDGVQDCAIGVAGELQLQTPYIMAGYLGDEAQTRAAFQDGWFRTGDLASRDADGFVTIVGRLKEMIVRGANKMTPLEIERALGGCQGVAAALVTGVPDPILGQRIHALLIPKPGEQIDAVKLRAELSDRLEKFKHPDACYLGTELPTGRTGKIDRGQLQTLLLSGSVAALINWVKV